MFWKYNLTVASHIGTLLEKEDVTLKELMDEDDILQECKAQRPKLIEFLVNPLILQEMVTLITSEPDEDIDERIRYKYPNIACELLTFDVAPIHDALAGNEALLEQLCAFVESEKPLNPLLSSFFSKIMSKLLYKKTNVMFDFLKRRHDFIRLLLRHIETSAVMDLLSRFMTFTEDIEMRAKIMNWLQDEQDVVGEIVMLIDPAYSNDTHSNAAQVLCDSVRASREHMSLLQEKADSDRILEAIESTRNVANLINHMFGNEKTTSVIVNGISVLLALLEFKKNCCGSSQQVVSQQTALQPDSAPQTFTSFFLRTDSHEATTELDRSRFSESIEKVLAAITPRLVDFFEFIANPPYRPAITLTYGVLDPPLGAGRLEVVRLFSALISTNNHNINFELATLKIIFVLMDLFFKYKYNNFLHTHVERIIETILITNEPTVDEEGSKVHYLLDQLLVEYKITETVLECFKIGDYGETCIKKNQGYMGHMTKIANHIVQGEETGKNSELIKKKLKEFPEKHQKLWEAFTVGELAEINKRNTTPLVGGTPLQTSNDGLGFKNLVFSQESSSPQMQQLASNYVDQFCFNEDFAETVENVTGQLDRMANVHFCLSEDYLLQRNEELFEQVCRDKNSQMPETGDESSDSDEDVWEEKERPFTVRESEVDEMDLRERKESEENSFDCDDGDNTNVPSSKISPSAVSDDETKMKVDNQDAGWHSPVENIPMDVDPIALQDPWGTSGQSSSTSGQDNWADFSNFAAFSSVAKCQEDMSSSTMETSETVKSASNAESSNSDTDIFITGTSEQKEIATDQKDDSSESEVKNGVV